MTHSALSDCGDIYPMASSSFSPDDSTSCAHNLHSHHQCSTPAVLPLAAIKRPWDLERCDSGDTLRPRQKQSTSAVTISTATAAGSPTAASSGTPSPRIRPAASSSSSCSTPNAHSISRVDMGASISHVSPKSPLATHHFEADEEIDHSAAAAAAPSSVLAPSMALPISLRQTSSTPLTPSLPLAGSPPTPTPSLTYSSSSSSSSSSGYPPSSSNASPIAFYSTSRSRHEPFAKVTNAGLGEVKNLSMGMAALSLPAPSLAVGNVGELDTPMSEDDKRLLARAMETGEQGIVPIESDIDTTSSVSSRSSSSTRSSPSSPRSLASQNSTWPFSLLSPRPIPLPSPLLASAHSSSNEENPDSEHSSTPIALSQAHSPFGQHNPHHHHHHHSWLHAPSTPSTAPSSSAPTPPAYAGVNGVEGTDGLVQPKNFAPVAKGLYRSSFPNKSHFGFLKTLGLRTVITLVQEEYPEDNRAFLEQEGIKLFQFGIPGNKEPVSPVGEENIRAALAIVLDATNHPLLIHCNKGRHRTGTLVGCLRKVQEWRHDIIIDEYTRFSAPKERQHDRLFIERFDTAPAIEAANFDNIPPWAVSPSVWRRKGSDVTPECEGGLATSLHLQTQTPEEALALEVAAEIAFRTGGSVKEAGDVPSSASSAADTEMELEKWDTLAADGEADMEVLADRDLAEGPVADEFEEGELRMERRATLKPSDEFR